MLNRANILIILTSTIISTIFGQYSANWMTSIGGKYGEVGQNSITDTEGNTYVSGWFQSDTCWFGDSKFLIKQPGVDNNFLAKINEFGQVAWIHHIYSKSYVLSVPALETDNNGNVFLAASYYSENLTVAGEITLNKPIEHTSSIFLLKFDSSGQLLNHKQWFGGSGATCKSLDINSENDAIVMAGVFQFYYDFGAFTLSGDLSSSSYEPYILKLSQDFGIDTAFSVAGIGGRYVTDVKHTLDGQTILSGYFQNGYMVIDADTFANPSSKTDYYLISFNQAMNPQWYQRSYDGEHERVTKFKTDINGNIFTIISFSGDSIVFKDTIIFKNAVQLSFLSGKMDNSGEIKWIKSGYFESSGYATDLAFIDSNSIVLSGVFDGEYMAIDSVQIENPDPNKTEVFLFKMNAENGEVLDGFSYGGIGDQSAERIHSTPDNRIVLSGTYFSDSLEVGNFVIQNKGNRDFYVLKLKPDSTASIAINPINESGIIYPNPANEIIFIDDRNMKLQKIVIWDLYGKMVLNQNTYKNAVDVSNLTPGIYLIFMFQKNSRTTLHKLMIQR